MNKYYLKKHNLLIKIVLVLVIAIAMTLFFTACDDDNTEPEQTVPTTTDISETRTNGSEYHSTGDIGEEKVKAIVLAKVKGATENNIVEFEREYNEGRIEYEGSIYYNGYEYDFDVDGATGNILQWEIDD